MSSLVIVAIPAEDDVVWKISSEKKPHLTLMYLGEASEDNDSARMAEFVEHALNINEHGPFYLDVDYRGELGDDKADVLFFSNGWDSKWIKSLRGQLLKQNDIRTAFESADQFPEWQPHLTLGYPDAPAKPFPKEYSGKIYSVNFDRIAVWTGDYEGPEFRLKWPEREMSDDMAIAYSDIGKSTVEELLHYGVKGQRWGHRKNDPGSVIERPKNNLTPNQQAAVIGAVAGGAVAVPLPVIGAFAGLGAIRLNRSIREGMDKNTDARREYRKDKKWEKEFKKDKKYADVHNDMADHMNSWLPGHNKKYDGIDLNTNAAKMKEYEDTYFKEQTDSFARSYSKIYGSSPSGKYTVSVVPGTNKVVLHNVKADPSMFKHAAEDDEPLMTFQVTHDKTGRIIKVEPVEDAMAQTADLGEEFVLEHASVLDDPNVRDKIKAKIQSILDDVTGDADQDVNLFGDPLVRAKLQSVLEDFYRVGVDKAAAYSAVAEVYLEHIGVKGMRWGHRKSPPGAVAPKATSKVPHGKRRKTKVDVEGGENHPAHEDAIKLAESQAKLKRSGAAALSNNELRDVATRLQLENQVSLLSGHKGKQFVAKNLRTESENLARTGFRVGVKKGVKRVGLAALA